MEVLIMNKPNLIYQTLEKQNELTLTTILQKLMIMKALIVKFTQIDHQLMNVRMIVIIRVNLWMRV